MRASFARSFSGDWARRQVHGGSALGLVIGVAGALLAWSASPAPGSAGAAAASVVCGSYRLELRVGKANWTTTEDIRGEAILTYTGDGAGSWSGSGSGPIQFGYREVGGELRVEPFWHLNLVTHEVPAAAPLVVPLSKSGGWADDEPHADFYRWFLTQPGLRLTPGSWDITAQADGPCDEFRDPARTARVRIRVMP